MSKNIAWTATGHAYLKCFVHMTAAISVDFSISFLTSIVVSTMTAQAITYLLLGIFTRPQATIDTYKTFQE